MITDFHFYQTWPQWLLAATLLAFVGLVYGNRRRRGVLRVFGLPPDRTAGFVRACARRRWLRTTCLVAALALCAVAALQPRCNPEKQEFGSQARDIAVIVDVSRSMLAEDLRPNRLERAKLEIAALAKHLDGDRIGLIAFAGTSQLVCPLTSDYSYFTGELSILSPKSAPQGGTNIGRAIHKALRDLLGLDDSVDDAELDAEGKDESERVGETVLDDTALEDKENYADIILITDGENHGYSPERAVEDAARHGVGLYVVGIGSEEGEPIPITREDGVQELLKHDGEVVYTRLDSKTLLEMVNTAPRGAYLPAGTDNFDLVEFYDRTIGQEKGRKVTQERVAWTEIFQPALLAGIVVYFLYLALADRPRRVRSVEWREEEAEG